MTTISDWTFLFNCSDIQTAYDDDQADENLDSRMRQDQGSHEAGSRHSGWSKPGGLQTSHEESGAE